jgi:hypothetical protein
MCSSLERRGCGIAWSMNATFQRIGCVTLLIFGLLGTRAQAQPGQQFDVWTGPSPALSQIFSLPLVGLSFAKPLTFGQVKQAAEGLDLQVQGIYFALPRQGAGGGSQPKGQSVQEALESARSIMNSAAQRALRASEVPAYFERTIGRVRLDHSKRVYTLRFSDLTNRTKMLGALENSADFRKALYEFTGRVASDFDTRAALENRGGLFYGMTLEPNSSDILIFAQRVSALGATATQVHSYASVQSNLPDQLAQSRARFTALKPDKPYSSTLYTYLLELMEEYKLTPKP